MLPDEFSPLTPILQFKTSLKRNLLPVSQLVSGKPGPELCLCDARAPAL